jgi:hypothetical protein
VLVAVPVGGAGDDRDPEQVRLEGRAHVSSRRRSMSAQLCR